MTLFMYICIISTVHIQHVQPQESQNDDALSQGHNLLATVLYPFSMYEIIFMLQFQ